MNTENEQSNYTLNIDDDKHRTVKTKGLYTQQMIVNKTKNRCVNNSGNQNSENKTETEHDCYSHIQYNINIKVNKIPRIKETGVHISRWDSETCVPGCFGLSVQSGHL